jgi:hypothetical protein
MDRTGWFWALYNLYDFFVAAAGIPILAFWMLHTWQAVWDVWVRGRAWLRRVSGPGEKKRLTMPRDATVSLSQRAGWLDALALAFVLGLLGMDLAGVARGEVARVWAFLLPLPLLVAVRRLPRKRGVFLSMVIMLSAQLFVSNVYVRYIGTDLSDPPLPPPAAQTLNETWTPLPATWEPGITLQAVQVPAFASKESVISIGTVWSTSRRVRRPYTVFVHMYDAQGELAAQRDVMPLNGGWPTSCWQPEASFEDRYELVHLAPLAPGRYRLELGLYWLPSGERVPVEGKNVQPGRTVRLGTIRVEGVE